MNFHLLFLTDCICVFLLRLARTGCSVN